MEVDQAAQLAVDACGRVDPLVHDVVEDCQQSFEGKSLWTCQLRIHPLLGSDGGRCLPLLAMVLLEEPLVRLGRVVGGKKCSNQ